MAGAKVATEKTEQGIPPNEAGREVLSYVQREEAEADAIFNEVHGINQEGADDDKESGKEVEKKAESQESEKIDDKEQESEGKEVEDKDVVAEGDDLTKGLNTENATKRISAAQNKMHDSNARAKTAEEQTSKLTEERDALLKRLEEKPSLAAAPAAEKTEEDKKVEAPKEDELTAAMEELNQEYPEIAKPMIKMMARQEVENKRLLDKLENLEQKEETRVEDAKNEKMNDHLQAIKDAHADFQEITDEPLFDEWINGLPALEKAGAQTIKKSGTTKDVIELLTTFKKANGYELPADSSKETEKKSNSKLEKAKSKANPSFNKSKDVNIQDGQVAFTRQQIDAMTPEEFAENEAAIDEAMSKGLVR